MRRIAALLITGAFLAGCTTDARLRRDGMTPFFGDTQAQVVAAQAVNPWPRKAYVKRWRWPVVAIVDPEAPPPAAQPEAADSQDTSTR